LLSASSNAWMAILPAWMASSISLYQSLIQSLTKFLSLTFIFPFTYTHFTTYLGLRKPKTSYLYPV
jgi:hypothetical protein